MLAVRWLHLLGMAVALGGAALTWGLFRQLAGGNGSVVEREAALGVASAYEWLFWGAAGLLVMTGVGNLGSLAPYVPQTDTRWGAIFAGKLLVLGALLLGSLVRTIALRRCRRAAKVPASAGRTLRIGYATTTLTLVGIVALGEVLAHG